MSATPLAVQSFYNQNRFSSPNPMFSPEVGKSPTGAPYLPGYLLGNANSPNSPIYGRSMSTGAYQNHSPSKMSSKSPPGRHSGFPYSSPIERKQQRISPNSSMNQDIGMKNNSGAPPTESLYGNSFASTGMSEAEALKRSVLNTTNDSLSSPARFSSQSALNNSVFSPRQETIPQSPAQIDPFYSQGDAISSDDVLDDSAVTVFGFPPAASSFILQQFAQYGTVEKHEIHNAGNWLHLKYQTKIQAKKALSKNGKIFARSIMIGVCPCIKKEILTMEAELNSSVVGVTGTPNININARKSSTMRPLSSTSSLVRDVSVNSEIMTNEKNTPHKRDSVVGKAIDYVFGW